MKASGRKPRLGLVALLWLASLPGCGEPSEGHNCGPFPGDLPISLEAYRPEQLGVDRGEGIREVDQWLVTEGDILLGQVGRTPSSVLIDRRGSTTMTLPSRLWPGGKIPYEVDPDLPSRVRVDNAIAHWNARLSGVIELLPRTAEPDWVVFARTSSNGTCASAVGRAGGPQNVFIGDACGTGNLIHEIGHLVGLWHEQNRADRNDHVQVRWENVVLGQVQQFQFAGVWGQDRGEYDFDSIMHYPADAFTSNGQPTIETQPSGIPIGQRFSLSPGDVAGVSELYGDPASIAAARAEACR